MVPFPFGFDVVMVILVVIMNVHDLLLLRALFSAALAACSYALCIRYINVPFNNHNKRNLAMPGGHITKHQHSLERVHFLTFDGGFGYD